jgi:hypothetical protein
MPPSTRKKVRHPHGWRTAIHEAGHAVIARVLTLPCGGATIEPNYSTMAAGNAITFEPYACLAEWEKRGKARSLEAALRARIITLMAGREAEIEFFGRHGEGDEYDVRLIEDIISELFPPTLQFEEFRGERMPVEVRQSGPLLRALEKRLRKITRMIVRRHRALIERTAIALVASGKMTGKQLDRLIGRSVNDVNVNAPILLKLSQSSVS